MNDRLQEYRLVIAKVDAKVAEVSAHQAAQLACNRGCHACCAPELTVAGVESAAIATFLRENPDVLATVQQLGTDTPWSGTRCTFLDATGACAIYPVRPLVCRTQGLPIALESGELTACKLNFLAGLTDLPPADRVDQRTLSTLLFVVDQRFGGGERVALTVEGVMGV